MKAFYLFIISCFTTLTTVIAAPNYRHNDPPFIFIENGVEYAIFKNGEFDFNILHPRNTNISFTAASLNISFNSGCNYQPYIARNRYGDIVQVNSTPIYYDYRGRVQRIGNVSVFYGNYGYVTRIGNLCISYTNYGRSYHATGYVNRENYYYQPRYLHYKKPTRHHHAYKLIKQRNSKRIDVYNNQNYKRYTNRYYPNKDYTKVYKKSTKHNRKESITQNNHRSANKKEYQKEKNQTATYRQNSNSSRAISYRR